jgi:hypothetical protein
LLPEVEERLSVSRIICEVPQLIRIGREIKQLIVETVRPWVEDQLVPRCPDTTHLP